jgi:hypothetical protein
MRLCAGIRVGTLCPPYGRSAESNTSHAKRLADHNSWPVAFSPRHGQCFWHVLCSSELERNPPLAIAFQAFTPRRTAMKTLTIKDIPSSRTLPPGLAQKIIGGRIKLREAPEVTPLSNEPHGGAGYTDLMLYYTLTVIE